MSSAASSRIRFVCPNCQMQLTVDHTLAGVTGPCPSCGSVVTAPDGTGPDSIAVQPRLPRQSTAQAPANHQAEIAPSRPAEDYSNKPRARSRPGHSVNPRTILSADHEEKQELRIVMKMFITAIVVAAVVAGVVLWLKYRH